MVVAEYAFAAVWGTYLLAWALAVVVLVVLAIMLFVSRGPSDTVRDAFRRVVATGAKAGSLHAVSQGGSPARVAAAIRDLRAVDPGFDATVFLDGSRMAVGAYAMAVAAMDDRLLRRIATPGYWQTTNGKALAAGIAEWRRYASGRPGPANQGRVLLEASWREPEVRDVVLGEQGIDRIPCGLAR